MGDLRCSMQDLFVAVHGLFIAVHGLLSSCGTWAPECAGSVVAERRLSCPMACGILVPRPGIEPESVALVGGFLTTGPPGKSLYMFKYVQFIVCQLYKKHKTNKCHLGKR